MKDSFTKQVESIKVIMTETIESLKAKIDDQKQLIGKLEGENNEFKRRENVTLEFFNEKGIKGHEHILEIIEEYYYNLYNNSDYLNTLNEVKDELSDIRHELFLLKIEKCKTKLALRKCKKIKGGIKEHKNKCYEIYKKADKLFKDYEEWEKIPKCSECNCDFDEVNIPLEVKKYGFSKLCKDCITTKLEQVIKHNKCINVKLTEEYKNSEFLYKLVTKNYNYLTLYSDLYEKSKEENYDLYDDEIISLAGFNPENPYDKYKLGNLCYRSYRLIKDFGEKIKYFDVTESELSRMGKLEFEALFNVTANIVGYDDLMDKLNIGEEIIQESDFEQDIDDDYIPDEDYDIEQKSIEFSRKMLTKINFSY